MDTPRNYKKHYERSLKIAKDTKKIFDEYWVKFGEKPDNLEDAVLEYVADTNEEFKALEDKLRVIEETDPIGKTAEHKKIMSQLDKILADFEQEIRLAEKPKRQMALFEKGV